MERRARFFAAIYLVVGTGLFLFVAKGFYDTAVAKAADSHDFPRFVRAKPAAAVPTPAKPERYVAPAPMEFPYY